MIFKVYINIMADTKQIHCGSKPLPLVQDLKIFKCCNFVSTSDLFHVWGDAENVFYFTIVLNCMLFGHGILTEVQS